MYFGKFFVLLWTHDIAFISFVIQKWEELAILSCSSFRVMFPYLN